MSSNLRKSQPNLSKPSEGESFNASRKASESTNPLQGLNITAQQELGSAGGIKATGRLTVGVDNLISQQGVAIEIDANNRTAGFGAGIGSTKGKLGVNIGGKVGYDEEGKISIKGVEAGINIGGFGGSASIDEDEGIRGSISVAGAKVEVGVGPDGKKSVSLCYGVPGGELCVTFEPDPGINVVPEEGDPPSTPIINRNPNNLATRYSCSDGSSYYLALEIPQDYITSAGKHGLLPFDEGTEIVATEYEYRSKNADAGGNVGGGIGYNPFTPEMANTAYGEGNWVVNTYHYVTWTAYYVVSRWVRQDNGQIQGTYVATLQFEYDYEMYTRTEPFYVENQIGYGGKMDGYKVFLRSLDPVVCPTGPAVAIPNTRPPTSNPTIKIELPNYPQHFKPMDCCDKVEEIYKYLGIAKLKKQKMKLAKALMVPKGQGNEQLEDYYEIMESLFRVMANGGIFNPISKPLGVEYQNVNATSWASEVYEMVAEAKSNGDSTQRFEMLASFQLVQMMKVLAEQRRMIECLSEAIGITPDLSTEEVPVMFTIHEAHKGFDKKQPKEIDISKAKTDDQVEAVLGKVFKPSKIPITKWVFNPNHISISEAINKL